jgi:hypothetical protein
MFNYFEQDLQIYSIDMENNMRLTLECGPRALER